MKKLLLLALAASASMVAAIGRISIAGMVDGATANPRFEGGYRLMIFSLDALVDPVSGEETTMTHFMIAGRTAAVLLALVRRGSAASYGVGSST